VLNLKGTSNNSKFVTPAQAGVQYYYALLDSCFRRNDIFRGSLKLIKHSELRTQNYFNNLLTLFFVIKQQHGKTAALINLLPQ